MGDTIDFGKKWTITTIQPAAPSAGADWSYTVPAGVMLKIRSMYAKLVTSSTVATRVPQLIIKDASGNILYAQGTDNQTASATGNWTWASQGTNFSNNGYNTQTLPAELTLPEGCTISTLTSNIQTGDQWSAISLLVEQGYAQ